jgi:diguanylate cyclase (GGDEF)-like protein/PAS domain S-box-containing protein
MSGAVVSADDMTTSGLVDSAMPDLFRLAMRQSAVAMCLVGLDGRFLALNPATCDLLAREESVLTTPTFQELTHPGDLDADLALADQVVAGEIDSYRLFKRYLRPDGSIVHGDLNVTGIRSEDGGLLAFLALIVDVSEREKSRHAASEVRQLLRGVIDAQLDPWVLLEAVRDPGGRIVDFEYRDANEAALAANRLSRDQLLSTSLLELLPGHADTGLFDAYARVVETGEPLSLDDDPYASELTDGQTRWFDNRLVKVGDGLSFTWRDVTDRVRLRQRLTREAKSDPLTGLVNRAGLVEAAAKAFRRSRRAGERIAVYYCDVDHLKQINDTLGHEWGDLVLRTVADRLAGTLRGSDVASRVGGDEFVIIADGLTDERAALEVATKIASAVTRPITHAGDIVVPTLSIGLALADPGDDVDDVLRRADAALYRRKQSRNDGTATTTH